MLLGEVILIGEVVSGEGGGKVILSLPVPVVIIMAV
jgi:hypothetical protein